MPAAASSSGRTATSGRCETAQDAGQLRHRLVRGSAAARRPRRLHRAAPPCAAADHHRRSADAAAELSAVPASGTPSTSSSPTAPSAAALTEAWRIAWMAYDHNILLVPHGWNTAIGLAADLHLTAALPVATLRRVPDAVAVHGRADHEAVQAGRGGVSCTCRPGRAWASSWIERRWRNLRCDRRA